MGEIGRGRGDSGGGEGLEIHVLIAVHGDEAGTSADLGGLGDGPPKI